MWLLLVGIICRVIVIGGLYVGVCVDVVVGVGGLIGVGVVVLGVIVVVHFGG